jgi:MFS family permease
MPVLIGFLAAAAAALFATGQVIATASRETLAILLGAAGFFSLGAYGGVNVVLAGFYPDALRATGIGWAKSVGRLGTVIAPILIGFALSAGISSTLVMSLFALPAVLAAVALVAISRTRVWRDSTFKDQEPRRAQSR